MSIPENIGFAVVVYFLGIIIGEYLGYKRGVRDEAYRRSFDGTIEEAQNILFKDL
jgi:hypothetical protein